MAIVAPEAASRYSAFQQSFMFRAFLAFLLMVSLAGLPVAQACAPGAAAGKEMKCKAGCCCAKKAACPCEVSGKTAPEAPVSLDRSQAATGVEAPVPLPRFILKLPFSTKQESFRLGAIAPVNHFPPVLSRICIAQI
jgi:hypothetical protein